MGNLARRLAALERAEYERSLLRMRSLWRKVSSEDIARAGVMFRSGNENGASELLESFGITEDLWYRALPPELRDRDPAGFSPEVHERCYGPIVEPVLERKREIKEHMKRIRSESSGSHKPTTDLKADLKSNTPSKRGAERVRNMLSY